MKERVYEKKFAGGMNMEIFYRILTWIITGTGCLLLMLIFAPFIIVLSPVGSWIILPLIYGGLLFYNWKRKIKKDTLSVGYYQISIIQIMLHACRMKCFTTMVVNILLLISSILCIPSQELTP